MSSMRTGSGLGILHQSLATESCQSARNLSDPNNLFRTLIANGARDSLICEQSGGTYRLQM